MKKILNFIGVGSIAIGVIFMALGFLTGGTWTFLLAAQVGLPSVLSGIVFMAFAYAIQLLERMETQFQQINASRSAGKTQADWLPLRLDSYGAALRCLRHIGDSVGGSTERQRTAILDFASYCNGAKLSDDQRREVAAWLETSIEPINDDLAKIRNMPPAFARRFMSAVDAVSGASGLTHLADDRKTEMLNAVARIKAATPQHA